MSCQVSCCSNCLPLPNVFHLSLIVSPVSVYIGQCLSFVQCQIANKLEQKAARGYVLVNQMREMDEQQHFCCC